MSESPRVIAPMGIPSGEAFGESIQISATSYLWITWTEIAIDHEAEAARARVEGQAAHPVDSALYSSALSAEQRASMVAITAASHALEALSNALVRRGPPRSDADSAAGRVLETLKRGFSIGRFQKDWARELKWLFRLRNEMVHFEETDNPVELHPSGANTARETARYAVEAATRAVNLVLSILEECGRAPRPLVTSWAASVLTSAAELRERRGPVECG